MNREATLKKFAKKLADLSLEDCLVSAEKVQAVLETLRQHPPRKPKTVLKYYLYYIKNAVNQSQATIEYAGQIDQAEVAKIEKHLSSSYNRPITATTVETDALIAGFRVSIGDDIFDASVAGRLNNLAKSVN